MLFKGLDENSGLLTAMSKHEGTSDHRVRGDVCFLGYWHDLLRCVELLSAIDSQRKSPPLTYTEDNDIVNPTYTEISGLFRTARQSLTVLLTYATVPALWDAGRINQMWRIRSRQVNSRQRPDESRTS